jgi:hypothetical protein
MVPEDVTVSAAAAGATAAIPSTRTAVGSGGWRRWEGDHIPSGCRAVCQGAAAAAAAAAAAFRY